MLSAILRRLYWRVVGSPFERSESHRRKDREHVPLMAIRASQDRYREPAALRVHREHAAISKELLELTRARHTLAAQEGTVVPLKKKEVSA